MYAIGGNEQAARLSGVPVNWIKILAYGVSGLFSAVAGICQASQELQGDPEAGVAYELSAIAMVVIGGTTLQGGKGSIWLTLIGILTIGYLEKILSVNAVGEDKRLMLTGAIIIAAVLLAYSKINITLLPYLVIVNYTNADIEDEMFKVFNELAGRYKIKSKIKTPEHIEMTIEIQSSKTSMKIVDEIGSFDSVINAAMMSYDGEFAA